MSKLDKVDLIMRNKIYIQYNGHRPYNHESSCAVHGAIESGIKYERVSYERLKKGDYDPLLTTNLFVGTVEFMKEVFNRLGIHNVRLHKNSNRSEKIMSLGEAKSLVGPDRSIFIKPVDIKLFTGFVLDESHYTCLDGIDDSKAVYTSEPFEHEILTEWRFYIHKHKVVFGANYSGDPLTYIPKDDITRAVEECKSYLNWPDTYVIDMAVLGDSKRSTVVIEYNDFWAIGNYGLDNRSYMDILKDRYFQIIKSAPLPQGDTLIVTKITHGNQREELFTLDITDWDKSDLKDLYCRLSKSTGNFEFAIEDNLGKLIKVNL